MPTACRLLLLAALFTIHRASAWPVSPLLCFTIISAKDSTVGVCRVCFNLAICALLEKQLAIPHAQALSIARVIRLHVLDVNRGSLCGEEFAYKIVRLA